MNSADLWAFLPYGYALTVAIELPLMLLLLRREHSLYRRVFAGFWLTACTYPTVVLVLPILLHADAHRFRYLIVAETFAPLAEYFLFYLYCRRKPLSPQPTPRDYSAITLANLASFSIGEILNCVK